jgi:hypothetical protein
MKNGMELSVKSKYLAIIESQNLPFIMKWYIWMDMTSFTNSFCVNCAFHFFISTPKKF